MTYRSDPARRDVGSMSLHHPHRSEPLPSTVSPRAIHPRPTHDLAERAMTAIARWWTMAGIWALAIGAFMLWWPDVTVLVLAVLLGAHLVVGGTLLVATNVRTRTTAWWPTRLAVGLLLITSGVLVWASPDITVRALGTILGVTFVVAGLADIATSLTWRLVLPAWAWLLVSGLAGVAVGIAVLVWPSITVVALAVVVGVYLVLFGATALVVAGRLRRVIRSFRRDDGSTDPLGTDPNDDGPQIIRW